MEISFYVLLVLACLVLLLAMWVCSGSSTQKWGPDLTLELPPHMLQEVFFGPQKKKNNGGFNKSYPAPSAPSELPGDPLLCNEHKMGVSAPPPTRYHRPAPKPPVFVDMESAVKVLPSQFAPKHKLRPVFSTFSTEEKA
ncbi:hypothetical protein JTE90_007233 [Oedothorax gibbosus]|uniref:Uncharacterized protein n=1 Tax=Oedothorax gibbosus TaxID=931172 RepID=A0AAV6VLM7_9ARAC|nr:hypothetical protein JTE90_007233 [Oedothorax gibbosus]